MDFVVEISGISQLVAALQQAPEIAAPILQRALAASQAILAKYTNKDTVPWRTGFLATNWRWQLQALTGYWQPLASYAPYVEFGTKPHIIEPKNAQALYWPGAQHPVKKVNHPGTAANPFMERIVQAATPDINATFGQALQQIVQTIAANGV